MQFVNTWVDPATQRWFISLYSRSKCFRGMFRKVRSPVRQVAFYLGTYVGLIWKSLRRRNPASGIDDFGISSSACHIDTKV